LNVRFGSKAEVMITRRGSLVFTGGQTYCANLEKVRQGPIPEIASRRFAQKLADCH